MARSRQPKTRDLDVELVDLPPNFRWREWMGRVEAIIFASPRPVMRESLARVVGKDCPLETLLDAVRDELRGRPYDIVSVAGGWQFRTRPGFATAIHAANAAKTPTPPELSRREAELLMAVGYFQPITRGELSAFFGREISRDMIAALRTQNLIAAGPRSPKPGAPYTYVTTQGFLVQFGFDSLRDLPDFEQLAEAGLLDKDALLAEAGGILGTVDRGFEDLPETSASEAFHPAEDDG